MSIKPSQRVLQHLDWLGSGPYFKPHDRDGKMYLRLRQPAWARYWLPCSSIRIERLHRQRIKASIRPSVPSLLGLAAALLLLALSFSPYAERHFTWGLRALPVVLAALYALVFLSELAYAWWRFRSWTAAELAARRQDAA